MRRKMIVAIDGPAGAGKGTIAKYLSTTYSLKLLETGLLYRLLAHHAVIENVALDYAPGLLQLATTLNFAKLQSSALRNEVVGNAASKLSVLPEIREFLTGYMRQFCQMTEETYQGVILDGRDIGTIVCPDAHLKLFITADAQVRTQRRQLEMQKAEITTQTELINILERDQRDQNRSQAPLKMAADAHLIDTTNLSIQEACNQTASLIENFLHRA